jgi:hypothetical protein
MSKLTPVIASLAFIATAPATAIAADLYEGGYAVEGVVDDDGPVIVERERVTERRYYPGEAYIEDDPVDVEVYARYRAEPYPDSGYWRAGDEW